MSLLGIILLILLVVFLFGSAPYYGYSRSWGYGPSGVIFILLIVLIVLLAMGRI